MNNHWNSMIYRAWSPVYDFFFNRGAFAKGRKIMFEKETFSSGHSILLNGAGTGADLPYLKGTDLNVTAIDLSPSMLRKAERNHNGYFPKFIVMDAQTLFFPDRSFDVVVANLILSVVPDPYQCFKEMVRVTKENGEIWVFDKFTNENHSPLCGEQILSKAATVLGTDIQVNFDDIYDMYKHRLKIVEEHPVWLKGRYRVIKMKKQL
ncbi:class I SAM-dependent methyltransferase [Halobacillus sp. A5]|uniref:class I SAM-dependent methyltransferase n=1 Tax=Halobacillus sp. A5 TaxID=2880263 RepID=UPI0020A62762|nr:class I SAM-dependent methyltransferase [Halobacillus sp. A5]MCP3028802.1 class I SAM-dependent methyltransferase [Halobacillus sp. A5]